MGLLQLQQQGDAEEPLATLTATPAAAAAAALPAMFAAAAAAAGCVAAHMGVLLVQVPFW
jgi:hypothetical protein